MDTIGQAMCARACGDHSRAFHYAIESFVKEPSDAACRLVCMSAMYVPRPYFIAYRPTIMACITRGLATLLMEMKKRCATS